MTDQGIERQHGLVASYFALEMMKRMFALRQSSVIPYRLRDGKVEVLLITSARHKHWIVPKGWISLGLSAADSAAKEAWEEAGVTGLVITPTFDRYADRKWGYPCEVEVFLMVVETVLEEWPERKRRKRQWLDLSKAIKQVKGKALKRLLSQLQVQMHDQTD